MPGVMELIHPKAGGREEMKRSWNMYGLHAFILSRGEKSDRFEGPPGSVVFWFYGRQQLVGTKSRPCVCFIACILDSYSCTFRCVSMHQLRSHRTEFTHCFSFRFYLFSAVLALIFVARRVRPSLSHVDTTYCSWIEFWSHATKGDGVYFGPFLPWNSTSNGRSKQQWLFERACFQWITLILLGIVVSESTSAPWEYKVVRYTYKSPSSGGIIPSYGSITDFSRNRRFPLLGILWK